MQSISESVGSAYRSIQYLTPFYHLCYKHSGLVVIIIIVKILKVKDSLKCVGWVEEENFRQRGSIVKDMNSVEETGVLKGWE